MASTFNSDESFSSTEHLKGHLVALKSGDLPQEFVGHSILESLYSEVLFRCFLKSTSELQAKCCMGEAGCDKFTGIDRQVLYMGGMLSPPGPTLI